MESLHPVAMPALGFNCDLKTAGVRPNELRVSAGTVGLILKLEVEARRYANGCGAEFMAGPLEGTPEKKPAPQFLLELAGVSYSE